MIFTSSRLLKLFGRFAEAEATARRRGIVQRLLCFSVYLKNGQWSLGRKNDYKRQPRCLYLIRLQVCVLSNANVLAY